MSGIEKMGTTLGSSFTSGTPFEKALRLLGQKLGIAIKNDPMPISKFKAEYNSLLKRAGAEVQQISQGQQRFVVLTESQVIAMAGLPQRQMTAADVLRSIPRPQKPFEQPLLFTPNSDADEFSLELRQPQ